MNTAGSQVKHRVTSSVWKRPLAHFFSSPNTTRGSLFTRYEQHKYIHLSSIPSLPVAHTLCFLCAVPSVGKRAERPSRAWRHVIPWSNSYKQSFNRNVRVFLELLGYFFLDDKMTSREEKPLLEISLLKWLRFE